MKPLTRIRRRAPASRAPLAGLAALATLATLALAAPAAAQQVRPEDMRPAEDGLPVTVRLVEPLGAHLLVTAEADGAMIRATLDSDLDVRPGDRLTLAPLPERVRWFDPGTTLAVGHARGGPGR